MSMRQPAKDQDKFVLRLPDGLRERLKASAKANGRSTNAEIVARLVESEAPTFLGASVRWATPKQLAATLHGDIATIIDRHIEAEVEARVAKIIAAIEGAR